MEILGIGPQELLLIIILVLILFGPNDLQKTGRLIGKWLRQIVMSDGWKLFQQTSREIQTLPNRLMREAQFDELKNVGNEIKGDLKQTADAVRENTRPPLPAWGDPPKPADPAAPQNVILSSPPPPSTPPSADEEKNA